MNKVNGHLFGQNTVDDIGFHNIATASVTDNLFSGIKMYPNPVSGNKIYFNVSDDVTVEVYNVLGKTVISTEVTNTKNNIDVSNLSKGIYILKINSGKQFITKKLIKN